MGKTKIKEYTFEELKQKGLLKDNGTSFLDRDVFDLREIYQPLPFFEYYKDEKGGQFAVKAAYKKDFKIWGETYKYNPKTKKYIV